MAFTESDLATVEAAIVSLATGSRPVSVMIGGKQISYARDELMDLIKLRDTIKSELALAAGAAVLRTYAKNGGRA